MTNAADQLKEKEEEAKEIKEEEGERQFLQMKRKGVNLLSFEARFSSDPTDPFSVQLKIMK